MIKTST